MLEIFQKLMEDKVLDPEIILRLRKNFEKNANFPIQNVLKTLGLSSEKISHYLSFQETKAEKILLFLQIKKNLQIMKL